MKLAALRLAVLAALALTFAAYLHPDMVLDVATRVWSCFGA